MHSTDFVIDRNFNSWFANQERMPESRRKRLRQFIADHEAAGCAVDAGETFAVAKWPDGKHITELRID